MPRGFEVRNYVDNHGLPWSLLVDADFADDTSRGWVIPVGNPPPRLPREFLPRVVVGVDATGRVLRTRIARVDAPLWTGAQLTFQFRDSEGELRTATIIGYQGERERR